MQQGEVGSGHSGQAQLARNIVHSAAVPAQVLALIGIQEGVTPLECAGQKFRSVRCPVFATSKDPPFKLDKGLQQQPLPDNRILKT